MKLCLKDGINDQPSFSEITFKKNYIAPINSHPVQLEVCTCIVRQRVLRLRWCSDCLVTSLQYKFTS